MIRLAKFNITCFLCVVCAIVFLSCDRSEEDIDFLNPETNDSEFITSEADLQKIGFSPKMVKSLALELQSYDSIRYISDEELFIIDDDIALSLESVIAVGDSLRNESKYRKDSGELISRHAIIENKYRTVTEAVYRNGITFRINTAGIAGRANIAQIRTQISAGVRAWNRVGSGIRFIEVTSGQAQVTIDVISTAIAGNAGVLALALAPNGTGQPGSGIRISAPAFDTSPAGAPLTPFDSTSWFGYYKTAMHEAGHVLGFWHTNAEGTNNARIQTGWQTPEVTVSTFTICGTPVSPPVSVMYQTALGQASRFAQIDGTALRLLYPRNFSTPRVNIRLEKFPFGNSYRVFFSVSGSNGENYGKYRRAIKNANNTGNVIGYLNECWSNEINVVLTKGVYNIHFQGLSYREDAGTLSKVQKFDVP